MRRESRNHCRWQSRDNEEQAKSGAFLKSGSGKSLSGRREIEVRRSARNARTATHGAVQRCSVRTMSGGSIDAAEEARHIRCISERGVLHGKVPRLRARGGYPILPECGQVEVACLSALRRKAGAEESPLPCCTEFLHAGAHCARRAGAPV